MGKMKTDVQLLEKNGRTLSKRIEYFESGQIAKTGIYGHNQSDWGWSVPSGVIRTYHENGQLKSEENYDENGVREGESVYFDRSGFLQRRVIYQKDRMVKEELFEKE